LGESRYVCIATVNNVIEAYDDPAYQEVMDGADLVTSDGVPLVWALRLLGVDGATRVYGPDLTPILCGRGAALGVPVRFYGVHRRCWRPWRRTSSAATRHSRWPTRTAHRSGR
jgi:N-acetylglucosaminyldiphosphoundecaprenol N-acetyl-beta-D-mannosaminyltransferase